MEILGDDKEWVDYIMELTVWATRVQLRYLFVTLIGYCEILDERKIWDKTKTGLTKDIPYILRKHLKNKNLQLTEAKVDSYALRKIVDIQKSIGKN